MTNPEEHNQIRRVTFVGMAINVLLAAVKITVGVLSRSQALVADGIHSVSDLATDLAVLFGAAYWLEPADREHPYGHRRIETIVSASIGIALGVVAFGIGWNAVRTLHNSGGGSSPGWWAFAVALLSFLVKEALFQWTARVGKRLHSRAVISNAWHHRSDALSSLPVAVAVLGTHLVPRLIWLDQIAAVLVSAMLLGAAWRIVWPNLRELIESAADEETEKRIMVLALRDERVKEAHALRTRYVGGMIHVDMHLLVDPAITVEMAHHIATDVQNCLLDSAERIADVLVHVEPWEPEDD
ncbi:MAG: cation transporter [Lentisphaeria bacterium]|nr:cation transporter [Lentisphaeria bacterium]